MTTKGIHNLKIKLQTKREQNAYRCIIYLGVSRTEQQAGELADFVVSIFFILYTSILFPLQSFMGQPPHS